MVTTPFEAQRAKALSMEREKNSRLVSTKLKEIFIKFWEYPDTKSTVSSTIMSPKRWGTLYILSRNSHRKFHKMRVGDLIQILPFLHKAVTSPSFVRGHLSVCKCFEFQQRKLRQLMIISDIMVKCERNCIFGRALKISLLILGHRVIDLLRRA